MSWRRLAYGMPNKTYVDEIAKDQRKKGEKIKITKGKLGYSILIWVGKRGEK